MNNFYLLIIGMFCLLDQMIAFPEKPICKEYNEPCSANTECCGGCCLEEKCIPCEHKISERATDPCSGYQCPKGQTCTPKQVQCIRAPCYPVASCN